MDELSLEERKALAAHFVGALQNSIGGMSMLRVVAYLHKDRWKEGRLVVEGCEKEFRCLGLSDQAAANAHSNPQRDPLLPFGDIPTGEYKMVKRPAPARPGEGDLRSYGPGPRFDLEPVSGDCFECREVRSGIELHGGPVGYPMPADRLRPTHGCLRVDDETITYLAELPGEMELSVVEEN